MRGARGLKNIALLSAIALGGLTMLAWTGNWFTLKLGDSEAGHSVLTVTGGDAAPGLIALALAELALVAALAISGPVFRAVLGVVDLVIGGTIVLSSVIAIADPVSASASVVTAATGVAGSASIAALVVSHTQTVWPWLAAVFGLLTVALGVFILLTSRRWPGSSRRYQPAGADSDERGSGGVSDWDTLSGGSDPTSR